MKKNTLLKMFIRRFVRAFFVTLLLVVVAFASYKTTMFYYQVTDTPVETKLDTVIKDIVNDVQIDEVSKNLIYSINEESSAIENIVLEVFNSVNGNLDYITIPTNTQVTISNEMYQRLCVVNPEIPQIIKISDIKDYFKKDQVYDYGIIIIEDILEVDISYYTVLEEIEFNEVFEEALVNTEFADAKMKPSGTVLKITENYKTKLNGLIMEEDLKDFITQGYENAESNLTLKNKLKYVQAYLLVRMDYIYYHSIYGEGNEDSFTIDIESTNQMIADILKNEAYSITQEELQENTVKIVESSIGFNIQVLNASNITGLAGKYKDKLTLSGFTIVNIGNYTLAPLTNTKIITNTGEIGLDLLNNFKEAKVESGELPEGIDIMIAIGTLDDITR